MAQPSPRRWPRVLAGLVITDVIALTIGLTVAYLGRILVSPAGDLLRTAPPLRFGVITVIGLGYLVVMWMQDLYRRPNLFSGFDEYRRILFASAVTTLLVVVGSYFWRGPVISRGFTTLSLLSVALFLCTGRFLVRRRIYRWAGQGRKVFRVIVVGANRDAIAIASQLEQNRSATSEIAGFLSEYDPVGWEPLPGIQVLGEPMQLLDVAQRAGADIAVVVESGLSWESLHYVVRMMHRRNGPDVVLVPSLYDLHATQMHPQQLGPVLALAPRPARITGLDAYLKRGLDITLGSFAALLGLPLMAVQAGASLIAGRGSGLVREAYVDGRGHFHLWRFAYPPWAVRAHISRLPSLLAVLSGRISLLGPRPIPINREAEYAEAMPLLESAKAGFIGPWWLVDRGRPASIEEELSYDLHYLRNYTIWFDLQILVHALRGMWRAARGPALVAAPPAVEPSPRVEGAATPESL